MMIRALAIAFFLAMAPMAAAQDMDVRDRYVEILQADGYREIRISSTFLGRLRFVATKPNMRREIVINPNTGVVLRDYIRFSEEQDGDRPSGARDPFTDGGGPGGSGTSDDDDDDDDDDHDDDDDGGSGSGGGDDDGDDD